MGREGKVLVVKIGAIGDVCLSLPMIELLKNNHITWVVGRKASSLLKATDAVSKIVTVDEDLLLRGRFFKKVVEVLKVWKILLFKRYDHIVVAHPDSRYKLLSLLCFRKKSSSFGKKKSTFPLGKRFHSLQYLNLIDPSFYSKCLRWDTFITSESVIEDKNQRKIALYPGGKRNDQDLSLRIWPIEYYVSLAKKLIKLGYQVVLVGSEEDCVLLPYFQGLSICNYMGKTSLFELISLLQTCLGFITHDGGPLHLARFAGCKICALFGPTDPRNFSDPMNLEETYIWGGDGFNCRPCYNGQTFQRCSLNQCMRQITPEMVYLEIFRKWRLCKNENSNSA